MVIVKTQQRKVKNTLIDYAIVARRLFPKDQEVQDGWHQSFEQLFLWICRDESLESVKCRKGLFFFEIGQPQKHSSPQVPIEKNMYLLTEWEGRSVMTSTQILVRGHDGPSPATSVHHDRVPNFFPSGSNKLNRNEFHYITSKCGKFENFFSTSIGRNRGAHAKTTKSHKKRFYNTNLSLVFSSQSYEDT